MQLEVPLGRKADTSEQNVIKMRMLRYRATPSLHTHVLFYEAGEP